MTHAAAGTPAEVLTDVLVVCEADRARSPVLAQLLRREAERRGLAGHVTIVDAGLRARPGEPLLPSVDRAVRKLGLGLEEHRATALDLAAIGNPGLVLTMTEDQRRALVRRRPTLIERTFTVREAVRLLRSSAWDPRWEGSAEVAARLHRLRPLVAAAHDREDVPDPAIGGRRLARSVVAELQQDATRLARALWGRAPEPGQTSTVGR